MLRLQYPGRPHFSFSGEFAADRRRWESLPPAKRKRIRLFTGHAPIDTGIPEADRDIAIITMLREPVSRVCSFCQHVSEGKSPHLRERFPPGSLDLDAFLDSGNEGLSNLQTKMLINRGRAAARDILEHLPPEQAVNLAVSNLLERIDCYGITERFDESLVLLQQRFGWRTPIYAASNRRNPGEVLHFQDRHLARIRDMNALDAAVYEKARAAWEQRVEAGELDESKLRRLRAAQPFASPVLRRLLTVSGLLKRARLRRMAD